jgi:hypothetical protein
VNKRRSRIALIVIISILIAVGVPFAVSDAVRFVVLGIVGLSLYGSPGEKDRDQLDAIIHTITTVHTFEHNSIVSSERPPVFGEPGSAQVLTQPTTIEVYYVRDRAEQDRIIGAIKVLLAEPNSKPVDLQFRDHENWIIHDAKFAERGPETQLRRVRITANRIRDDVREKLITPYPLP